MAHTYNDRSHTLLGGYVPRRTKKISNSIIPSDLSLRTCSGCGNLQQTCDSHRALIWLQTQGKALIQTLARSIIVPHKYGLSFDMLPRRCAPPAACSKYITIIGKVQEEQRASWSRCCCLLLLRNVMLSIPESVILDESRLRSGGGGERGEA